MSSHHIHTPLPYPPKNNTHIQQTRPGANIIEDQHQHIHAWGSPTRHFGLLCANMPVEDDNYIYGVGNEVIIFLAISTVFWGSLGIYVYWQLCHNRRTTVEAILSQEFRNLLRTRHGNTRAGVSSERSESTRPVRNFNNSNCPICLEEVADVSILTNCGHVFDLSCFKLFWQHHSNSSSLTCPCCRTRINMIHPNFDSAQFTEEFEDVRRFNRLSGAVPRSLLETINDFPVLLRQLIRAFFSRNMLTVAFRLRMLCLTAVGFLYLLSPFDLIPELVFGIFGYVDDILVWFIVVYIMTARLRSVLQSQ